MPIIDSHNTFTSGITASSTRTSTQPKSAPKPKDFIVGLGLTKEENEILFMAEMSLWSGVLPIGIKRVHELINRDEYRELFGDCIVTAHYDTTYVQRIKQTKKYLRK